MVLNTKYSVLMSVYYQEQPIFLKASIESMLQQTLKPNEIVIVCDGKLTKELNTIISFYKKENPDLFTIIFLEQNRGLGKALDIGLKHCKNELVARMDTDDISLPTRCEIQIKEFNENKELSILGTMIDEFFESPGNVISSRVVPTKHEEIVKFSKRRNPFNHPSVMYKKTDVLESGGYGNYRRNQDLDLFIRMLYNGCISKNINKSLVLFRANRENLHRRKSWEKSKSYIYIIYNFWRRGHSNFGDLMIVAISQLIVFFSPAWVFKYVSDIFLRKNLKSQR